MECMNHELSIRTAYQSLLTSLKSPSSASLLFIEIEFDGLSLDFLYLRNAFVSTFAIACESNARNVDIWRIHIVELVKGIDIEQVFKEGKYG